MAVDWICREENSHTRILTSEAFEEVNVPCDDFCYMGTLSSPTAIKETILNAPTDSSKPIVSVMSRHVIKGDIDAGRLFESRIKGHKIERKFYIAYLKERKHDAFVDNVVNYLLSINKVPVVSAA